MGIYPDDRAGSYQSALKPMRSRVSYYVMTQHTCQIWNRYEAYMPLSREMFCGVEFPGAVNGADQ